MIITISVFAISKGNPSFITPKTLQCVLQKKQDLVLLAAKKHNFYYNSEWII